MRTLKKTLCLVLALVLCLGLASVAFAGNFDGYTDADEIGAQYKEAVDVLMAIGVVNGMTATEIGPEGTFTREQAAKIITYLDLGGTLADALKADADPFDDVKAERWSAGYIAYCESQGIIMGYGDGNFGPTDELTGIQWAAMLLRALGYGKNGEYEGKSWAINVSKDALPMGIFNGDASAAVNEPIQRQQAMLMAFNALNISKVVFSKDTESYLSTSAYLVDKFDIARNETEIDGITGHNYVNAKGEVITDFYTSDVLVGTYGAGTTAKAICADLGITAKTEATAQYYANLVAKGSEVAVKDLVNDTTTVIPAGVTVDVYKTAEGNFKVMATIEYVVAAHKGAKVTDGENAGKTIWTFGDYSSAVVYAGETDYTNGAMYLVVPKGDNTSATEFLSVSAAKSVQGVVTAKGSTYAIVGGTKYTFRTGVSIPAVNAEKVLYLATDGSVLYVGDPAGAPPVAETVIFVVDYYSKAVPGTPAVKDDYGTVITDEIPAKTEWYVQAVDMNGAEVSYLVAIDGTEPTGREATLAAVSYNASTKLYELTNAESAVSAAAINKDAVSFTDGTNSYYYNAASYVSVIGSLANLKVSEGTLAAADANNAAWAVFSGEGTNKTVSKVFYWAEATAPVDTTYSYTMAATGAGYIEESSVEQTAADGTKTVVSVYTYEVYLSGEKTQVMTYTSTLPRDFYKYAVDEYGVYEVVELDGYEGAVANVYGNYITITGIAVDYDITGIKVVDLRVGDAADGKIESGDTIAFYAQPGATAGTYIIDCIYITA